MADLDRAKAILVVCAAFLQDTDPTNCDARVLADSCLAVTGLSSSDQLELATTVVGQMTASGRWSLFLESVQHLRNTSSNDSLQQVITMLTKVSLADGHYAHAENQMIFGLGKLWDIHGVYDDDSRSWSVFTSVDGEQAWTPVHDLAVLYLGLAHRTDRELAHEEVSAINRKLAEWLPDSLPEDVNQIVGEAMTAYSEGNHDMMLATAIRSLGRAVPAHQRMAVLSDLMFVARADQVVLVEEKELIALLAASWAIDPSSIS